MFQSYKKRLLFVKERKMYKVLEEESLISQLRLSPGVRQPVKTLVAVRWKILDRQYNCTSE